LFRGNRYHLNDEARGGTAAAEELSGLEILLLETAVEFNASA
jgi:hypothetical protein